MSKFATRLATVAAIALASIPVLAVGAAHAQTRTATVGVSDLDFARRTDVARFETRVNLAAYKVCPAPGRSGLRAVAACEKDVRQQAVRQLGSRQAARMAAAMAPAKAFDTAAR